MRVTAAFSRLLDLRGVWVRKVCFEPDRVVVTVALCLRRLQCPKCSYLTWHRESRQHHDSSWRHLDLGRWRLEVRARLRRLRCPEHGVRVEGVPFARDGARFTRDFENLVAWLATKTDKTATCRLTRIDWHTIGRIIVRVGAELIDTDRLSDLYEISIDEVPWRKGHRYLTLVGDHRRRCVVWGCEGKGQAAADAFFEELGPPAAPRPEHSKQPRLPPEPAIMVPFGPCPTVDAGHGIHGAWLEPGLEIEPAIFARASKLCAVSGHDRRLRQVGRRARPAGRHLHRQLRAPRGAAGSCGVQDPTAGLSRQPGEAEGSLTPELRGRTASSPDNDATCQDYRMARARQARRTVCDESEPVIEPPQAMPPAQTRWIWAGQAVRGNPEIRC